MNKFFDEHKALIITILLFSLLLLLMYNIRLSNNNAEMQEMLVNLEQLRQEEPEEQQTEEPEEPEERPTPPQTNVQTHQAFNQNREVTTENFQQRLDEIFEKNSAEQTASEEESTESSQGEFNLSQNSRNRVQERSDGNNTSDATSAKSGTMRNSSIAFSLVGRSAYNIPNPIYTCDTSGKIVVNIIVNAQGAVTRTSLNKGSSTSTNDCLVDNALEYAAGALFSPLNGRNEQKGTITYFFQG